MAEAHARWRSLPGRPSRWRAVHCGWCTVRVPAGRPLAPRTWPGPPAAPPPCGPAGRAAPPRAAAARPSAPAAPSSPRPAAASASPAPGGPSPPSAGGLEAGAGAMQKGARPHTQQLPDTRGPTPALAGVGMGVKLWLSISLCAPSFRLPRPWAPDPRGHFLLLPHVTPCSCSGAVSALSSPVCLYRLLLCSLSSASDSESVSRDRQQCV